MFFNKIGKKGDLKPEEEEETLFQQQKKQKQPRTEASTPLDDTRARIKSPPLSISQSIDQLALKRLSDLDEHALCFYAGLVACSLVYKRPCKDEKGRPMKLDADSKWSIEYFDRFIKHIQLSERQKQSLLLVVVGEIHRDITMYANEFKQPDKCHLQWTIMQDLVHFSVDNGMYDARARVLIRVITTAFGMPWRQVQTYEDTLATELRYQVQISSEEEKREMKKRDQQSKWNRLAMVGAATVGGGLIIGLTAGLAAPFIAAGAGILVGGSGAAFLASAGGIALIATLFGGAGAGLAGKAMSNRMGDLKEFEFQPLTDENHMHVVIAVTGWVQDETDDFREVWRSLDPVGEQFAVRWESHELGQLGQFLVNTLGSKAIGFATVQILQTTVLHTLLAAVAWPATLLSAGEVIDNSWARCAHRADTAGIVLADTLAARVQGHRPVVLIGYSLGARMIFACLEELARRKVPVKGLVEDVYLFGAPVPNDIERWQTARNVVAGRFVNCYTQDDWILGFLYRSLSAVSNIAGISPVIGVTHE
eukprot:Ihof_evm2s203 gene=Ihof_evmTU2s203